MQIRKPGVLATGIFALGLALAACSATTFERDAGYVQNAIAALESATMSPSQTGLPTRPPKIQALLLLRAPES